MTDARDPVAPTPDAEHFDRRFRADPDPWGYAASSYEREKYWRTLDACGPAPLGRVLELGGANGVFTGLLAERARSVVSIDFSASAVEIARERLAGSTNVDVLEGTIPDDLPDGEPFDVVIASEVLYYLPEYAFRRTVDLLPRLLREDGLLVAVHWTGHAPDLVRTAAETHRALRVGSGLRPLELPAPAQARGYLLDAYSMR